jgi:hypothetical protein
MRAREVNPSFRRILRIWFSTVRSEIESSEAIRRLVSPRSTHTAISSSRRVPSYALEQVDEQAYEANKQVEGDSKLDFGYSRCIADRIG